MSEVVHHLGFVVFDVEETMKRLADSQGIKPWSVWTIKPDDPIVRGKQVPYSFKIAMASLGNTIIELIAPHEGKSIYADYLKEKGEGFHHMAMMYPSQEELDKAVNARKERGEEVLQGGRLGPLGSFYYFDTKEMGLVMELLYASQLPPPEKTYP